MAYNFDLWRSSLGHHPLPALTLVALSLVAAGSEYFGRWSTWKRGAPRRVASPMDRSSYPVIALALLTGLSVSVLAFLGQIGTGLPYRLTVPIGALLILAGLGLRVWSMRTLGRFFTMPITIRPDHDIVRAGPYQYVRHPAYTGSLLAAIGVPVLLGTSVGLVVTVAVCLAAYGYRIHREEAVLRSRFGARYREYAEGTARLIPHLY